MLWANWLEIENFAGGGGVSHIDMVYVYVPAFWGTFSKFGILMGGGVIKDEGAQISKFCVF